MLSCELKHKQNRFASKGALIDVLKGCHKNELVVERRMHNKHYNSIHDFYPSRSHFHPCAALRRKLIPLPELWSDPDVTRIT